MKLLVVENLKISLISIKSHLLRTIITVLIIGFGIMAIISILTAVESIKNSLNSNFARMGSNTFSIKNRSLKMGHNHNDDDDYRSITYKEALDFKNNFNFPAYTSLYTYGSRNATLKFESKKTNPNVLVIGSDENYLITSGFELTEGRNFSTDELVSGAGVVIIGSEIQKTLFKKGVVPTDKWISIGPARYKIIGVLKSKGTGMGFSGDKNCIIPLQNLRQFISGTEFSYTINVMTKNPNNIDIAMSEATGLFRVIRKLPLSEKDNFAIEKSDNLAKMLFENLKFLTLAATIIGIITLLSSAIGLMNIMLVSVTERTREIGLRKALGAKKKTIITQFLIESILLTFTGGIIGMIFGIITSLLISKIMNIASVISLSSIFLAIGVSSLIGIIFGLYPARKAASLQPIEALRFE